MEAEHDGLVRPKVRRAAAIVFVLLVVYLLASATVLVHSLERDVSHALEAQLSSERARAADAHKFQTQLADLQDQLSQAQGDLSAARSEVESLRNQLSRLGIQPETPGTEPTRTTPLTPKGSQPAPSQESASGPAVGGDASDAPSVSPQPPRPQPQPEPTSPSLVLPSPAPSLCLLLISVCL